MHIEVVKKESTSKKRGNILFVHGVCHDATCWHNYLDYFSAVGFDTYALSLRGHGNSDGREFLDQWSLSDYVTDVVKVALSLDEKPIIVGHSMGGAIVQKILGEDSSILRAAVLLAPAVEGGLTLGWKLKRFRKSFFKALKFIKIVNGLSPTEKEIKSSLFLDDRLDIEQVRVLAPNLQAESKRAQHDLTLEYTPYYNSHSTPVLVLGSKADLLFPEEDLIKTAKAYGTSPVVLERMCHDMMIDPEWELSAVEIQEFVERDVERS